MEYLVQQRRTTCGAVALLNARIHFDKSTPWSDSMEYPHRSVRKLCRELNFCEPDGTDPREFEKHPWVGNRISPTIEAIQKTKGFFVLYSFRTTAGTTGAHYFFGVPNNQDDTIMTFNRFYKPSLVESNKTFIRYLAQSSTRNVPIEEGEKYSSWAQHIEFPIVWEAL